MLLPRCRMAVGWGICTRIRLVGLKFEVPSLKFVGIRTVKLQEPFRSLAPIVLIRGKSGRVFCFRLVLQACKAYGKILG